MKAERHPVALIFKAFEAEGLQYGVLRNPERALRFPQEGDLDIIVSRGESRRAQAVAASALAQAGWSVLRSYRKHHRMRHVLFVGPSRAAPESIRVDLIEAIGWGPFSLLSSDSVLARKKEYSAGFSSVSHEDAAACALADGVLFPGSIKSRYIQPIHDALDSDPVSEVCRVLFGRKRAQFEEALKGQSEEWKPLRKIARRRLSLGQLFGLHLLSRLFWGDLIFFVCTLFSRLICPQGWVLEISADENIEEMKSGLCGLVAEVEFMERKPSTWALYKSAVRGRGVMVQRSLMPGTGRWLLRGVIKSSVAGVWGHDSE